jgi:hypothetical protein
VRFSLLLHFLRFDIHSRSLDLEPWLRQLYRSNDLTAEFPDRQPRLELCVERVDRPAALPIEPPPDAIFTESVLCYGRCHYGDGRFHSAHHGDYWHEIEYDPVAHRIRANLGGAYLDSGQFAVVYFVRPLLNSFILPFYGLKSLHGAVLSRDDRTVFLAGSGGAGKSTTAAQLLRAGWEVLADDAPLFTLRDGRALALSPLDYLHVTRATLRLFPELQAGVIGVADHKDKFAVNPDRLGRGFGRTPQRITHLVHLRRETLAHPRVTPLDRPGVLRDLLGESMTVFRAPAFRDRAPAFRRHSEFIFDVARALVRDAATVELRYDDRHLAELPALLAALPSHGAEP